MAMVGGGVSRVGPILEGDAALAVGHRGSHVQIVACAGAGKTEVMAQRIASLLRDGEGPEGIVALTFNVDAAGELAERASTRLGSELPPGVFVGTLHSFAHTVLKRAGLTVDGIELLADGALVAMVAREGDRLGLSSFGGSNIYAAVEIFLENLDVVENELLDSGQLVGSFRVAVNRFGDACSRFGVATYGSLIRQAAETLSDPSARAKLVGGLSYVLVDEYQDINPAQEQLISQLASEGAELCVVGDDDQAIYGWRGADVANILTFPERYEPVQTLELGTNRRSRPAIVSAAERLALTMEPRLEKAIHSSRDPVEQPAVVVWTSPDREAEAAHIAEGAQHLISSGHAPRDIAVLARSRHALEPVRAALADLDIGVSTTGTVMLFASPLAQAAGMTVAWLAGKSWRPHRSEKGSRPTPASVAEAWRLALTSTPIGDDVVIEALDQWSENMKSSTDPTADLLEAFHMLGFRIAEQSVSSEETQVACELIRLFEDFTRASARTSVVEDGARYQMASGGRLYKGLWAFIQFWAAQEQDRSPELVDEPAPRVHLGTVHGAKGREWPVVFVAGCTDRAFPSTFTGKPRDWMVPLDVFDHERYEGRDVDERRLFYVAITRARELVSISSHERAGRRSARPSPYIEVITGSAHLPDRPAIPVPAPAEGEARGSAIGGELTEVRDDAACGLRVRVDRRRGCRVVGDSVRPPVARPSAGECAECIVDLICVHAIGRESS